MEINKGTMKKELISLLKNVFQLPEVYKVQIRGIDIISADESEKISSSVEECYHDVLSDIDVGIHVTLHPNDVGNDRGIIVTQKGLA